MHICLNRFTGLNILRACRAEVPGLVLEPAPFEAPDSFPFARWSRKRLSALGIELRDGLLHYMTPSDGARIATQGTQASVYASLPSASVVGINDTISIARPELLFVECGVSLSLAKQVLLGMELCGTYSLGSSTAYDVAPVANSASLRSYIASLWRVRGKDQAIQASRYVLDNAWSPMEAVLAAIIRMPVRLGGYGMDCLCLNARSSAKQSMRAMVSKRHRVPDLTFDGTTVGINYDGAGHLDLDKIAQAAIEQEKNRASQTAAWALENAKREVRDTYVDDRRRERDLWVQGMTVFTITKEDLYEYGALDTVMLQVAEAIERSGGQSQQALRNVIANRRAKAARNRLLMELLP